LRASRLADDRFLITGTVFRHFGTKASRGSQYAAPRQTVGRGWGFSPKTLLDPRSLIFARRRRSGHVQLWKGDSLSGLQSICVLIVDDDRAIREALAELLQDEGYAVRSAANGREGLDVCASLPLPNLILLDLSMPVMDGFEFANRKQNDPAIAAIPVCVMTAAAPSSPAPAGVSAILRKPLDLDDLIAAIGRLCDPSARSGPPGVPLR
jgi:CheY-like chemotaxis protein